MDPDRYDFLDCKRYVIHAEHEKLIRPETLAELDPYQTVELYNRERIRSLSHQGLLHTELRRLLDDPNPQCSVHLSRSQTEAHWHNRVIFQYSW